MTSVDSFSRPPTIPNTNGGGDDRSISTSGTGQSMGRVGDASRRSQTWTPFMENNNASGVLTNTFGQEGRASSLSNDWPSSSELQSPSGSSATTNSAQNPPLWIGDFSLNGGGGDGDRSGGGVVGRDYDDHSQNDAVSGWSSTFGGRSMGGGGMSGGQRDFVGNNGNSGNAFFGTDNRPQGMSSNAFDLNGKRGAMRFSNSAPSQLFKQQGNSSQMQQQQQQQQQARPNSWEVYPTSYHRAGAGVGGSSDMSRSSFNDFGTANNGGLVGLYGSNNNPGNRQSMMKQSMGGVQSQQQQQASYGQSGHNSLYSTNDGNGSLGSNNDSSFHHMSSNAAFGNNRKYHDWS